MHMIRRLNIAKVVRVARRLAFQVTGPACGKHLLMRIDACRLLLLLLISALAMPCVRSLSRAKRCNMLSQIVFHRWTRSLRVEEVADDNLPFLV